MAELLSVLWASPYLTALALVAGFVLLIYGADWLVDGASSIAQRFGVSSLVIGLTVVAFGTSMPEFVVSMLAAVNHNTELAITNVLGSNSINTFVVLGLTALIFPISSKKSCRVFDIPLSLIGGVLVLVFVLAFGCLNRLCGIILLLVFLFFLWHSFRYSNENGADGAELAEDSSDAPCAPNYSVFMSILLLFIGLFGLVVGGELIVQSATTIAQSLGVSDAIIGLTVVALGTSLPELATSCMAAYKQNVDLALGNVIGSNIFNIFFILGTGAVISPLPSYDGLELDACMVVLSSLMVWLAVLGKKHQIGRCMGACLLLVYALYLAYRLYTV